MDVFITAPILIDPLVFALWIEGNTGTMNFPRNLTPPVKQASHKRRSISTGSASAWTMLPGAQLLAQFVPNE
jgi:hypothetical protein